MAARCTTPAAAMHHFGGMGAPFQRWPCTIICGQAALLERRTQLNEEVIKDQIKELVRGSVEETLNELLEVGAQKLIQAARYKRNE